jgi:hypothetical protein
MVEGSQLHMHEQARITMEGEMTIPADPIPVDPTPAMPTQSEFVLHDALAVMLQGIADKYGIQVTSIEAEWREGAVAEAPWRIKRINSHSHKMIT